MKLELSNLRALALALVLTAPAIVTAQQRLQRDGITLYWGLVPEAIVSQRHALDEMHGGAPRNGGHVHHLVVALFNRDGSRIGDAVVRGQLGEIAIVDAPPKYMTPMSVDGQLTYGQWFSTATLGPYRLRVFVKPAHGPALVFTTSASPSHGQR